MQVGSIVRWKYSGDKLFIVVTMVKNPFMDGASVGVVSIKSGKSHDIFVSDLEVICSK
jgi:hypothetical protein